MSVIEVAPLSDDLDFGLRIRGVDEKNSSDLDLKVEVNRIFDEKGLIVFEDVEPSNATHAALSKIFGPLHIDTPGAGISKDDAAEGFVNLEYDGVSEVDGASLKDYVPWHFDQCYSKAPPRGGVLRAISISPEGGLTGFADGMQLYEAIATELRGRFEDLNILYDSAFNYWNMKFGAPKSYRPVAIRREFAAQLAHASRVRSIHPAIWERPTGERILHISPMQAAGIEGMETDEGDALLEAMCQEIYAEMRPYYHRWKPTDMVIWDNWRFIHSVTGHPPDRIRAMRRTVIFGDYGLGRVEQ